MEQQHMGMNRTGIQMSPHDSEAMQDVHPAVAPTDGDVPLGKLRAPYLSGADHLGSVPLPGTLKGALKSGASMLKGDSPQVLLDKLGERLAFERTGTRLYDCLIGKCELLLDDTISMRLEDLHRIRDEEHGHIAVLIAAIRDLGGDPTAQTPAADVIGVASSGLLQVVADPRTSVGQSLQAMLTAELTDGAGWETLIALADAQSMDELVNTFSGALETEREHLGLMETWCNESLGLSYGDVDLVDEARGAQPPAPLSS